MPSGRSGSDGVIGVVLTVVLLAAVVALLFWLRRRSSAERVRTAIRESAHPTPATPLVRSSAPPPSEEQWICPTCRVGFPASRLRCPTDGTPLEPYEQFSRKARDRSAKMRRCPTCGKRFSAPAQFCGEDGASLVDE
jgi:hypothetical protein